MKRRKKSSNSDHFFGNRILVAQIFLGLFFGIVVFRLFHLQVVEGGSYAKIAQAQRVSTIEIPAKRGEILVRDKNTGALIKMATNTTLDLVYIDPAVTPDKRLAADTLAAILYTNEDFEECLSDEKFCPEGSVEIEERQDEAGNPRAPRVVFPDRNKAVAAFADEIFRKINREYLDFIVIARDVSDENLDTIVRLATPGVDIVRENSLVYLDPTRISQDDRQKMDLASKIGSILEIPSGEIFEKMELKKVRYVKIDNKIRPEISEKIKEIKEISRETNEESKAEILASKSKKDPIPDFFRGIVLVPEHWRYYPDGEIGAHLIGFVNNENHGQYGIEGKFDKLLMGKSGKIESEIDVKGRGINPNSIQNATDGSSIVLTIDRIVQKKIENVLDEARTRFRADSAQIIVLEPKTGKIIAMANSPRFDPNNFGDAFLIKRTDPEMTKDIFKTTPLFTKDDHGRLQTSSFEEFQEAWKEKFNPEFFVYRNRLGPGVFVNRAVQEAYEPGSVFKPLVMAAAIDTAEVTPSTTYNEDGPVQVGNFWIKTATGKYLGTQTMTNVLETSSNVGMSFVALRLGKSVMHSFLTEKYRFGDYTDIELDQEEPGKIMPKKDWSDALLLTSSFGQGLTATPIQMVRAWGALANGGVMMQPQIVDEILSADGAVEKIQPHEAGRAISADTATTMTQMLVSSVEKGVAHPAKIPGYRIAGKTGTSQVAGRDGKYETGDGAYITSFGGYAPADNPRFVVLVKFDRPRIGENTWGSTTGAPIFREVMQFLFDYYDVPPTE